MSITFRETTVTTKHLAEGITAGYVKSGRSLREQLEFARYVDKRAADPNYTFRKHLRRISGAMEE